MPSFTQLLAIASMAMVSSAVATSLPHVPSACRSPAITKIGSVAVGSHTVLQHDLACQSIIAPRAAAVRTVDISTTSCFASCSNDAGVLPPVQSDCDTISNAITILQGTQGPTFTTAPQHVTTLTFQTCSFGFTNLNSGSPTLKNTWVSFNQSAVSGEAACFPPVQPFSSEGLCVPSDGTWLVSAAHTGVA